MVLVHKVDGSSPSGTVKGILMTDKEKIANAVGMALAYGQVDGSHHKMWVIDQMVRILCGALDESDDLTEYNKLIQEWQEPDSDEEDEDGESFTYEWDVGIPP